MSRQWLFVTEGHEAVTGKGLTGRAARENTEDPENFPFKVRIKFSV